MNKLPPFLLKFRLNPILRLPICFFCLTAIFLTLTPIEMANTSNSYRSNTIQTDHNWLTYRTETFGYSIDYPANFSPLERQTDSIQHRTSGAPSDIWFGDQIHIISRIPAYSAEFIDRNYKSASEVMIGSDVTALKVERPFQPVNNKEIWISLEYLVRGTGVDYIIKYESAAPDNLDEQFKREVFEQMVSSFRLLDERSFIVDNKDLISQIEAEEVDGFDFFVSPPDGGTRSPSYASYNVNNPYLEDCGDDDNDGVDDCHSTCYDDWLSHLQHSGEDWFRNADTNVYAVANGTVVYTQAAGYPGGVVIIEHELPTGVYAPWGGNYIYSMYGHTNPVETQGEEVTRGQHIGDVYDWSNNSHVHFEMRRYADMRDAPDSANGSTFCNNSFPGPGYTDTGSDPAWFGYTHPSNWIDEYRTPSFGDVPLNYWAYPEIEALYRAGFVAGCATPPAPLMYCPEDPLKRSEMAVFVLRGTEGGYYEPDEPSSSVFADTGPGDWYNRWANALYEKGYTAGCSDTPPLMYCPNQIHTRAEAAVFFLRIKLGSNYLPSDPSGIFADVALDAWYAGWVEKAYEEGLIDACEWQAGRPSFCPNGEVSRAHAARYMVRAQGGLPLTSSSSTLSTGSNTFAQTSAPANSLVSLPPTILKGTYLGGTGHDVGNGIAVDDTGHIYVVGYTDSSDFPIFNAYQDSLNGTDRDVFVAKINPDKENPVYITYLGGSSLDEGYSISVDNNGNATIMGYTDSIDFPTQNPIQTNHGGERDLFVARLDTNGELIFSTFLGGSNTDEGHNLTIDDAGNIYVVGETYSTDFPTSTGAWQASKAGGFDAFIVKINTNGTLGYSTYLGGALNETANGIAVDELEQVYVIGNTSSTDLPIVGNALQETAVGGSDVFVAKLNANGSVAYSTYFGGISGDFGSGVDVDDNGNIYIVGYTASKDFPILNPLQATHEGGFYDLFISKINATRNNLIFSTYLGNDGGDESDDIVVDDSGAVYVTGLSSSINFPTSNTNQAQTSGTTDVIISKLNTSGDTLLYSLYLGGSAGDHGDSIVINDAGKIFVTGYTLSANFPHNDGFQPTLGGNRDAFILIVGDLKIYLPFIQK